MDEIKIDATERTPRIDFDFLHNSYSVAGESYPEDISEFYGPVIDALRNHLESRQGTEITFEFEMIYFNSSSAKVFMGLFNILDKAAVHNRVVINWYFEEDDDSMEELGEEYGEDLKYATFNLLARS